MKVHFFAGDIFTTFTARVSPLVRVLESYDIECKIIPPIAWRPGARIARGRLGNLLSVVMTHNPKKYVEILTNHPDVVIIGRTSTPQMYLLQKLLKSKGVKIIFDLDDALFLTTKFLGFNINPGSFCLDEMIKEADFVTVNGHYLLNYVKTLNEKSAILHDPVVCTLFSRELAVVHDTITIGWVGSAWSHYENLALLVKPLERIATEHNIRFKMVSYLGDPRTKVMFKKLRTLIEVDYGSRSWLPLSDFAKLTSDFDIMVAPLQPKLSCECKSALRVGEGMALGIPIVASPVGEQKYVIQSGINGFLAKNEEEWYTYLKMLVEDEKLRDSVGKSGRETVEKELSSLVCGKKLFDIIEELLK